MNVLGWVGIGLSALMAPFVESLEDAPLSPSCMLNNFSCPMPRGWEVDWALINSTAMMSINFTGFDPEHHWGLVTLDWQCGAKNWVADDPLQAHCEATSRANCLAVKQSGMVRRCSIYHNMELALEWLESERAVMDQVVGTG